MAIILPLLFADGHLTSLEKVSENQLEKFIPFMLSCCPEYCPLRPPIWWPHNEPFEIPLIASKMPSQDRLERLKEVVCRCYEFHKCEHVLRFCSRVVELPAGLLKYKEANGYVSIYNKFNNKLIVTFKKKNQDYDKPTVSPCKNLLPRKPSHPPAEQHIEDIYLCNYCDEEFTSGKDAVAHESFCYGKASGETQNNEDLDQEGIMRYFGLCSSKRSLDTKKSQPKRGTSVKLSARTYMSIPISSPLGLKMSSNSSSLDTEDKMECIQKCENYCRSASIHQSKKPRNYGSNFYRHYRRRSLNVWAHTYCFNKAQRRERKLTLKTGLNKEARNLLRKCKNAIVLVERLPILDPLALHAAARLKFQSSMYEKEDKEGTLESLDLLNTVCIDLCLKENDDFPRDSSEVFFSSSSNHKRPPLASQNLMPPITSF